MNTTTPNTLLAPLVNLRAATQIRTRNGFDEESLQGLAASIREHGVIQPLIVRPDTDNPGSFVVVAGERRMLAASLAGLEMVPIIVRDAEPDTRTLAVQAVENIQRVDLTLLDRADGVAALVADVGLPAAAQLLGKSKPWVSKLLTVSRLAEPVRLAAQEGECDDAEILQCVHQLGQRKAEPVDVKRYTGALKQLADGTLTRQGARAMLDAANADEEPAAEAADAEGEADAKAPAETLAKLELAESTARVILAAVVYANAHKPSSRPGEAAESHVRDFVAKHWGAK